MTILVSAYVREGIVMAADSRLTVTDNNGEKVEKYTATDNMVKVFLLKKIKAGVSHSGDAYINDMVLSEFIEKFDEDILNQEDTVETASIKLMQYIQKSGTNNRMHICGYTNKEPFVYLVDRFTCVRYNNNESKIIYNVLWCGHGEPLHNLFMGEYPLIINFDFMPLKDAIELVEFMVNVVIKVEKFQSKLSTCGGDVDILVLTPETQHFHRHKVLNPKPV
ncbi:hypothetical protein ACOSZF_23380 [Cytobacillus firmus]|uniref:hypothetical protein n=1 Tax=Cytobacillus firmus TaxID=1399 RepID=UPI0036C0EA84